MGLLKTAWLMIKMRILWFLITAAVIAGAVLIFGPRSKQVDTVRRVLADRVLDEIIRDIERRYIQHEIKKRLAVFDFAGDGGDYLAERLRKRLRQKGLLLETKRSTWQKALDAVGIDHTTTSPEKAAKIAKELGADAAIIGRVGEFTRTGDQGAVTVELTVADAETERKAIVATYASVWPGGTLDTIANVSAGWRLLIWIAVAIVVPLAAYPLIRATLDQELNWLTFLLLFTLTALDVIAALVLLGFAVRTVWVALLVISAFGGGGAYNYLMLNSYEKMRI